MNLSPIQRAENARQTILDAAPACIEERRKRGRDVAECEALRIAASAAPTLSPFAVSMLAQYASEMREDPPTWRTIRNLLRWVTLTQPLMGE